MKYWGVDEDHADYLIKGGRVIDPSRGIDEIGDVATRGCRIVEAAPNMKADHVVDATGCLVVPGLIDHHVHCFYGGNAGAIHHECLPATGVTTAVDAGSAGASTYPSFQKTVVEGAPVRILGYLTPYGGGQLGGKWYQEDFDPSHYDRARVRRMVDTYRSSILGFKVRISRGVVPELCAHDWLASVVEMADELGRELGLPLRVCVHTTDCPIPVREVADLLRPGDIFCHCYQGGSNGIVTGDGRIENSVKEARRRGVLFDAANGGDNFALSTCCDALSAGFLPDIISTDSTRKKFGHPTNVKSLPVLMSKYLSLGMSINQVVACVTDAPARAMGFAGRIGTLAPGSAADVTVLRWDTNARVHHIDAYGTEYIGSDLLVPELTIGTGELLYCAGDFWV